MDEVERARAVLERERTAVLTALRTVGEEGREAAAKQREWRARARDLLARGDAAGVPVSDMAHALGLSRQWTTHLLARTERRERARRLAESAEPKRKGRGDV